MPHLGSPFGAPECWACCIDIAELWFTELLTRAALTNIAESWDLLSGVTSVNLRPVWTLGAADSGGRWPI